MLALRTLHFLYAAIARIGSFCYHQTCPPPQLLQSARLRLPKNLALVFVSSANVPQDAAEQVMIQSCRNAVEWCGTLGIPKLTIYDRNGLMV